MSEAYFDKWRSLEEPGWKILGADAYLMQGDEYRSHFWNMWAASHNWIEKEPQSDVCKPYRRKIMGNMIGTTPQVRWARSYGSIVKQAAIVKQVAISEKGFAILEFADGSVSSIHRPEDLEYLPECTGFDWNPQVEVRVGCATLKTLGPNILIDGQYLFTKEKLHDAVFHIKSMVPANLKFEGIQISGYLIRADQLDILTK